MELERQYENLIDNLKRFEKDCKSIGFGGGYLETTGIIGNAFFRLRVNKFYSLNEYFFSLYLNTENPNSQYLHSAWCIAGRKVLDKYLARNWGYYSRHEEVKGLRWNGDDVAIHYSDLPNAFADFKQLLREVTNKQLIEQ